jgi:hypothetical protein
MAKKTATRIGTLLHVAVRLGPQAFALYQGLGARGYTPTRLLLLGMKAAAEVEGLVPVGQQLHVFITESEELDERVARE